MIINNFNITGSASFPLKADTKLIIDADRILSTPAAFKQFKPVAWWKAQILNPASRCNHNQFTLRRPKQIRRKTFGQFSRKNGGGSLIFKQSVHDNKVSYCDTKHKAKT